MLLIGNKIRVVYLVILIALINTNCNKTEIKNSNTLFTLLKPETTNIDFVNKIQETHIYTFNYVYNGAGVAIIDINNDGLQDVFFTGNQASNRLYLNKGNFKFEDISKSSGIDQFKGWNSGVSTVDINCDGYADFYICRGGFLNTEDNRNLLLINQKNNTFIDEAKKYGVDDKGYSITSTFFDYDNDGDLDLYVTNRPERWKIHEDSINLVKEHYRKTGKYDTLVTDRLYRNNGNETFTDVSKAANLYPNYGYGLSATAGDLNKDGFQDLYVANDFIENDYFYINYGDGTFKESSKEVTNHVPYYSMGVDFGDINNDCYEEIYAVEMRPDDYKRSKTAMPLMQPEYFTKLKFMGFHDQYMHNTLQYNFSNGFFGDIAQMAGVDKTDWSWAALINDLDNDGFKDIYVTNGFYRDVYDIDSNEKMKKYLEANNYVVANVDSVLGFLPSVKLVNYIYKNQGDLTFKKMMKEWGIAEPSFSNGAAFGDLDNDGDLDLVVNNINDPAFIYKNNSDNSNNYLRVMPIGDPKNPLGIGAKITITTQTGRQYIQLKTSRGYLSSSEAVAHFGLEKISVIDKIEVQWPDFTTVILKDVKANQLLKVNYSEGAKVPVRPPAANLIFNENTIASIRPAFYHIENSFDDFKNQRLLPHRMSRLGPFISVADANGDGKEDFYIGSPHGKAGCLYLQNDSGLFDLKKIPLFEKDKDFEDMHSLFFDCDGDKDLDLYVVSGGTEYNQELPIYQDRLYINDGKANFSKKLTSLPKIRSSGSCVEAYDFDGDGDLDLFRGGRVIPEKYPYPPRSYFLVNNGKGTFEDKTLELAPDIAEVGMVTSAVWVDINKDSKKDLILAGEWMPITVFENNGSSLKKAPAEKYGLQNTSGWWNTIQAVDYDKDGNIDLVGGNLGLNYKFHASIEKPFFVYCDDYDENGTYDIVLAKYNGGDMVPIRGRQCSSEQTPSIATKFPSYHDYADANLNQIYGDKLDQGLNYKATMFHQENGKFVAYPMNKFAQFSTLQGFIIEDFNQDGIQDFLLAGNQFNSEIETTRADASPGFFYRGSSKFFMDVPYSPIQSGFYVPYDVKDIKAIKVKDKLNVLVGINNNALYYFNNVYSK